MTVPDQDVREHERRDDQRMRDQNQPGKDPRACHGAKAPRKPFTIEERHRKVRSFGLRRTAERSVLDEFQRVAVRWSGPLAGCDLRPGGDD